MRKVTEKTFKAYAKEAVKQLNTLEIRATLYFSCMGAEINLYREENALVGRISISFDGSASAKDWVRNENFDIEPLHNTMKDLFMAVYETVNSRLDDNGFKAEEECELTDEQIINIAGHLYVGGWTMLDVDMIAAKTGTNKKTAHRIMVQISTYINHALPEDMAQESEEAVKQEGRTITVTLHPEDEEEERTITYTGVKSISFATGKAAERIEAHTDESSIDKDHEYMVIIFNDHSKATFRRSSVVKVQEEGKLPVIDEWDEDEPTADEKAAEEAELSIVKIHLDCRIKSWYENAKLDHGINGKFIDCKAEGDNLLIFHEEEGKKYITRIGYYKGYTPEQIYNIWMEDGGCEMISEEIERFLPQEAEELQLTPEDADKEIAYDDFTPEPDYTEDETKVKNGSNDIEAYLECNIMKFYDDAKNRRNIDVDGRFIGCKEQDNMLKIFWKVNGLNYVLEVNNYKYFTPVQIFDFWVDDCGNLADSEEIAEVTNLKQGNKLGTATGLELLEQQLTQLEKLEEESDKADDAWDKEPLNTELEEVSNKAYERECKKHMDAARTLGKLINMDTKTTRQMLQRGKNREKVWSYLKRSKAWNNKK